MKLVREHSVEFSLQFSQDDAIDIISWSRGIGSIGGIQLLSAISMGREGRFYSRTGYV